MLVAFCIIILLAFVAGFYVGKLAGLKQTTQALKEFDDTINFRNNKNARP